MAEAEPSEPATPCTAPSNVSFVKSRSFGKAIADSMPRMMITVTNSTRVKPRDLCVIRFCKRRVRPRAAFACQQGSCPEELAWYRGRDSCGPCPTGHCHNCREPLERAGQLFCAQACVRDL